MGSGTSSEGIRSNTPNRAYFFYSAGEAAEIARVPIYTGPSLVEDDVPVAHLRVIAPPRFLEKRTRRATDLYRKINSHPDGTTHFRKCIHEIAAYIVHLQESAIQFSYTVEELRERYNSVLDALARAELKEAAATEYQISLYQTGESAEYARLHQIEPAPDPDSGFDIKERGTDAEVDDDGARDSLGGDDTANIVASFHPLAAGTEAGARRRRELAARLEAVVQRATPDTMSLSDIRTLEGVAAGAMDWDTIRVLRKCLSLACAKLRIGADHKYTLEHINALLVLMNTIVFCVEPGNRDRPDHTLIIYQPWHADTGEIHGWTGDAIDPESLPRRNGNDGRPTDCRLAPTTRLTHIDDTSATATAEIMDTHYTLANDPQSTPVYHVPIKNWTPLLLGVTEFIAMLEETVPARPGETNARPRRVHPTTGFIIAERAVPRYICMLSTLKGAIQLFCNIPAESRWGLHIRVHAGG